MHAQWDDDVHHALHALLTGERRAYYVDFGSLEALAKVLTSAFFHDGTFSTFRGHMHGRPVDRALTPGHRFVVCLQNHDQVGNREAGERITALTSPELVRHRGRAAADLAVHADALDGRGVGAPRRRGRTSPRTPSPSWPPGPTKRRIDEFADAGTGTPPGMIAPQDPAAFYDAKLKWDEVGEPEHARDARRSTGSLIALRRAEPDLADPRLDQVEVEFDEEQGWLVVHRGSLRVVVNSRTRRCRCRSPPARCCSPPARSTARSTGSRSAPRTAVIARAR